MALRWAGPLFLLFILPWSPEAAADETTSVVFWLGADPTDVFPRALVEEKGISLESVDPLPAHCAAPHEPDPALKNKIEGGIDLFYSNDFEASESTLRDAWMELGKGKDLLDIPPSWMTACFAFRMLMFKAVGMDPEAEGLAGEAAGSVHPSFLEDLDIPPDGHAYILEMLDRAAKQGHGVEISAPPEQEGCSLWVDGVRQPAFPSRLTLLDGVHWIRAACGDAGGWTWRVELPLYDGRTLHLDPKAESRCDCRTFPIVACSDPTAGIPAMAANVMLHPRVRSCFVLKEDSDTNGILLSGEITAAAWEPLSLQTLAWDQLGETPPQKPVPAAAGAGPEIKPRLNVPALVLAAAGSGMAVVSLGLGAGSVTAASSVYTHQDPWLRAEEARDASTLENAALVTAGVAASLLVTSLIYHIVIYRKHKKSKNSK